MDNNRWQDEEMETKYLDFKPHRVKRSASRSSKSDDDPDYQCERSYKAAKRGRKASMATAPAAAGFVLSSGLAGGEMAQPGGGGGGGGDAGDAATVTVTASALGQNGTVEVSLDSPEDSSNGAASNGATSNGATAQVTAQVVVSSNGMAETTIVTGAEQANGSPHYITVTEGNGTRSYTSLTPVNPTVVSDGDAVGTDAVAQGVHPTYVQYVEGSDQAIYAATNGQIDCKAESFVSEHDRTFCSDVSQLVPSFRPEWAYPVYTVGETGTMYTPASGQYYAGNTTAVTYSQVAGSLPQGTATGQLLAQGNGGTYLIQQGVDPDTAHSLIAQHRTSPQTVTADPGGGVTYMVPTTTNPSSLDGDGHPSLSHATRVSPATVQWLLENYETAEGVSLPRSTLYNHYLRHCSEHKLDPVNAASFGKLIRSVFLGLRTRRLGTRGNSKYHYYGIRVKPGSSLNQLSEDGTAVAARQQPSSGQKRYKFLAQGGSGTPGKGDGASYDAAQGSTSTHQPTVTSPQHPHHHQYLGDGSGAIPDFPDIEFAPGMSLPEDCTLEDVDTLRSIYREHCEAFLDAVVNLEFQTIESLWREFWRSQDNNNGDECEEEKYLSKTKLYLLCKCGPVQQFIRHVDYLFYQNLVEVLIPDVLRPIPSSLTQAIRNFAKGLESWLTGAMGGCPEEMLRLKVSAVAAFAQTLRRYTSLNHLAQAARAVLQNSSQIGQMLVDLNRVDFHNVQEQASWVCQCDDDVVQRLEADFKATLQQQNSLEQWAAWLKGVVSQALRPYQGKPNFSKAARQFLLKWSFYSSMVIRDLTLRSAASFGSFHLIRLLYDEYMFFLIEHQVALETGETPIAVMGEKFTNGPSTLNGFPELLNGGLVSVDGVLTTEEVHGSSDGIVFDFAPHCEPASAAKQLKMEQHFPGD